MIKHLEITSEDKELIAAATEVIRKNYKPKRHLVGCALKTASGKMYTGINFEACGHGPHAEQVAAGTAFSNSDPDIVSIACVLKKGEDFQVVSPCGNCRQFIFDYAPNAQVIYQDNGKVLKTTVQDLLPGTYGDHFDLPDL